MKDANNIEDIFKEKLHDLESPVRAELWSNISTRAHIQSNFWSVSKIAGLGAAVLVVSAGLWYGLTNQEKEQVEKSSMEIVENDIPKKPDSDQIDEQQGSESSKETPIVSNVVQTNKSTENNKVQSNRVNETTVITNSGEPATTPLSITFVAVEEKQVQNEIVEKVIIPKVAEESKISPEVIDNKQKVNNSNIELKQPETSSTLDLKLIAPEKSEEVSRESKHFPSAFPRIFNPNLSGDAAAFTVEVVDVSYFKIEIRNQKGQLVYSSQDPNFVWKGTTLDGSMAPEGTYIFLIESNDLYNQALKPQSGAVFLMRK